MDESEIVDRKLEELAPYIGKLVIAFASLEDTVNTVLNESINERSDFIGWTIIGSMTFSSKVDLIYKLNSMMLHCFDKEKELKQLEAFVKDLKDACNRRNDIVHAAWSELDVCTNKVRTKTKHRREGPEHITVSLTPASINESIKFIEHLSEGFYEFWGNMVHVIEN